MKCGIPGLCLTTTNEHNALYGSEAEPKKVFGTGQLLGIFEATMGVMVPAVWSMTKAFVRLWKPTVKINSWVLPDNAHVHVKVVDKVKEMVNFLDCSYETIREVNQPKNTSKSLGPNVVHSKSLE